jgi:hypothetical protein
VLILRRLLAAVVVASVCGFRVHAAPATPSDAFDQIRYRDTGGFGVGGRGISLTITGSGNLEAQVLKGPPSVRTLQGQELAELHAAVSAVDWSHVEHDYRTPGAADLVTRNLTMVIRGQMFETHADGLAKIPDALRELFSRLDALYRRSTRPEKQ